MGISMLWTASSGEVLWRYLTEAEALGSPAFVWGVVYVGSDDGYVYALDAENANCSGAARRAISFSSPVIIGGMVYAGSEAGYVHALDAESGALVWSSSVESPVQSSPIVIDGKVYVSTEYGHVYVLFAFHP